MKIRKPKALTLTNPFFGSSIKITHTISMPVRCNGNGAYDWCTFKCKTAFSIIIYIIGGYFVWVWSKPKVTELKRNFVVIKQRD